MKLNMEELAEWVETYGVKGKTTEATKDTYLHVWYGPLEVSYESRINIRLDSQQAVENRPDPWKVRLTIWPQDPAWELCKDLLNTPPDKEPLPPFAFLDLLAEVCQEVREFIGRVGFMEAPIKQEERMSHE